MKKLFKLREWLTLEDTSEYLTLILGEEVRQQDVYRLALDGHLKMSVNLVNHAYVRKGKIIGVDEVEWFEISDIFSEFLHDLAKRYGNEYSKDRITKSLSIDDERYIDLEAKVTSISGVWDLTMFGSETLDLEHCYQQLTGGPEITLQNLEGPFLESEGVICQIVESFDHNEYQAGSLAQKEIIKNKILINELPELEQSKIWEQFDSDRTEYLKKKKSRPHIEDYYPANGLPEDSVLVVKVSVLEDFIKSFREDYEKPLHIDNLFINIPNLRKPELLKLCMKLAERYIKREGTYPDSIELWNMLIDEYADDYDQEQRVIHGLSGIKGLSDQAFRKKFDEWTKLTEIKTD